jgi:hypothetical protein
MAIRTRRAALASLILVSALSYGIYLGLPPSLQKTVRRGFRIPRRVADSVLGRFSERDLLELRRRERTARPFPFRRALLTCRRAFLTLIVIVRSFAYTVKGLFYIVASSIRSAWLFVWRKIIRGFGAFEVRVFARVAKFAVRVWRFVAGLFRCGVALVRPSESRPAL